MVWKLPAECCYLSSRVNFLSFVYFPREMTSEGLKLREKAPKDLYGCDKTLLKVKYKEHKSNTAPNDDKS